MLRSALTIAALLAIMALPPRTHAAPPTVTPSPGYDARLQQERAARAATAPPVEPAGGTDLSVRHHLKRKHHSAH